MTIDADIITVTCVSRFVTMRSCRFSLGGFVLLIIGWLSVRWMCEISRRSRVPFQGELMWRREHRRTIVPANIEAWQGRLAALAWMLCICPGIATAAMYYVSFQRQRPQRRHFLRQCLANNEARGQPPDGSRYSDDTEGFCSLQLSSHRQFRQRREADHPPGRVAGRSRCPGRCGLAIEPATQAPWWLKRKEPKSPQPGSSKQ
jgi:hypothetical protein